MRKHKTIPPPRSRAELEREYGRVWDTAELAHEFVITAIIADQVVVRRKADDVIGTLTYQDSPRLYFSFTEAPVVPF